MSVKLMTTEQIHTNLATIANMWPGGIPTEQADQVNALRAELKRRGVEMKAVAPASSAPQKSIGEMDTDQLSTELRKLSERISKDPSNEELQEQFANIRFELRNRTKAAPPPPPSAPEPETNGKGHVAGVIRTTAPFVQPSQEKQETNARAIQEQVARARDIEAQMQLVRKHNLAKCAADVAAQVIRAIDIGDVDGDIIEEACTLGVKVAETIFTKVGL